MPDSRRCAGWCAALALLVATDLGASQVFPSKGTVELAFSPADDPEAVLVSVVDAAHASVHVQAYVFTSKPIARALLRAHQRGVAVSVLADAVMNARGGGAIAELLEGGVALAFETRYAAAHNKLVIVDATGPACAVVTGSYNFTWSARNRNAENLIVLRDNCPLARAYLENWSRHREEATTVRTLPFRLD